MRHYHTTRSSLCITSKSSDNDLDIVIPASDQKISVSINSPHFGRRGVLQVRHSNPDLSTNSFPRICPPFFRNQGYSGFSGAHVCFDLHFYLRLRSVTRMIKCRRHGQNGRSCDPFSFVTCRDNTAGAKVDVQWSSQRSRSWGSHGL